MAKAKSWEVTVPVHPTYQRGDAFIPYTLRAPDGVRPMRNVQAEISARDQLTSGSS